MLQSETMFPPQKTLPKLEHGRYTATNVRWGLALDLDAGDDQMLMSWGYHGRENQQWEFRPCGAGYLIVSVKNGSFIVVRDIRGLLEGSAEVVTGAFPTCWEVEVMYNGNRAAEDGIEDENGDVYVRILYPLSEMAMSFKGDYAGAVQGARVYLTDEQNDAITCWRLSPVRQPEVAKNSPILTNTRTIAGDV